MIDTVRFKINTDKNTIDKIKLKSIETKRTDLSNNNLIFKVYNSVINVGSYKRGINIFIADEQTLFMELSIPKFVYGHNVFLYYPTEFIKTSDSIYTALFDYFGCFPTTNNWEITRLDICYSWKLDSQEEAQKLLNKINAYKYPRKQHYSYNTAIMATSNYYSVKWYLKKDEFLVHDLKHFFRTGNQELGHNLSSLSEGIIRFEVSMRRQCLSYYLKKHTISIFDINLEFAQKMLNKFFGKYFNFVKPKYQNVHDILEKLNKIYSLEMTKNLFLYLQNYNSPNPAQKSILKYLIPESTQRRYRALLKKADIGSNLFHVGLTLTIPDKRAPNLLNPTAPSGAGDFFTSNTHKSDHR